MRIQAIIIAALLCSFVAHAATYSVVVKPINNDIWRNESATYDITISNFGVENGNFQAYTANPNWNLKTDAPTIIALPNTPRNFKINIQPTDRASSGTQGVSVTFKDLTTGAVIQKSLVLSLKDSEGTKLTTRDVAIDVLMPTIIDPFTPFNVQTRLRNKGVVNLSNLTLRIESSLFDIKDTRAPLNALTEKTVTSNVYLLYGYDLEKNSNPPPPTPGTYNMTVILNNNGIEVGQVTKEYSVRQYTIPPPRTIDSPDTSLINIRHEISPEKPSPGQELSVKIIVKNNQDAAAYVLLDESWTTRLHDLYTPEAEAIIMNATENETIMKLLASGRTNAEINLQPGEETVAYEYRLLLPPTGFNGSNITGKTTLTVLKRTETYNPWAKQYEPKDEKVYKDAEYTIYLPKENGQSGQNNIFKSFWNWIKKVTGGKDE